MSEEYTCIECENLYDDTDGDTDEKMCNECLNKPGVNWIMSEVDRLISWIKSSEPTTADKYNKEWLNEKGSKS